MYQLVLVPIAPLTGGWPHFGVGDLVQQPSARKRLFEENLVLPFPDLNNTIPVLNITGGN